MSAIGRRVAAVIVALAATASAACVEDGIGMTVPSGGARWSGPGSGTPDVLVAGGPVFHQ
jgi:hypothetical protein